MTSKRFLLVYGSQTGQAQAIAEEVAERAEKLGLEPSLHCFSRIEKEFSLEKEPLVVFVVSTTGDGEPPDTLQKFWRRIRRKTILNDHFCQMKYMLLGLGDSNYTNFCNCGKSLDNRLKEIGANTLRDSEFADDAVGIETVAEPWIDKVLAALCVHYGLPQPKETAAILTGTKKLNNDDIAESLRSLTVNGHTDSFIDTLSWSKDVPIIQSDELTLPSTPTEYLALTYNYQTTLDVSELPLQNGCNLPFASSPVHHLQIASITGLTKQGSVKDTLLVKLNNKDGIEYEAGDTFSIVAQNDSREVDWLISRLGLKDSADTSLSLSVDPRTTKKRAAVPPFINNPSSIREILTHSLDIRHTPKKAFLRLLADHCSNDRDRLRLHYLSSKQGADAYRTMITETKRGFLDLLTEFRSCTPPLKSLFENLPRLLPRPYSAANDGKDGSITFAFNVVYLPNIGSLIKRQGLVSGLLDRLYKSIKPTYPTVAVFSRTQQHFRLPEEPSIPLILIGPGTGVAPYIGFLKHREELTGHVADGTLDELHVCFSRDIGDGPRYVTDLLRQQSQTIADLMMSQSAVIYVCGDAQNMAKDVNTTITQIIQQEKGLTEDEILTVMKSFRDSKRYREDVWI